MKVIMIDAEVGIKSIKTLRNWIEVALELDKDIVLDFRNVRRIDLSVAQVLMAATREAARRGATMKLKSVNKDVKNQLHVCGVIK
jgi:anti-anti-sigma factor